MKHRTFIILISSVVLICIILTAVCIKTKPCDTAKIFSDGVLVSEIDLSSVKEPYELPITYGEHINVLLVERGQISVKYADCPDKLCKKQGFASSAYPIICLPNKLMIIKESIKKSDKPNAVSR